MILLNEKSANLCHHSLTCSLSSDLDDGVSIPYMGVNRVSWGVYQACIDLLMHMSINGEYLGKATLPKMVCVCVDQM